MRSTEQTSNDDNTSAGSTSTTLVTTTTRPPTTTTLAPTTTTQPPVSNPSQPLISRGQIFMSSRLNKLYFPNGASFTSAQIQTQMTEKFNRYYTDVNWVPLRTIYVSAAGTASIAQNSSGNPSSVATAISARRPGDLIFFLRGTYNSVNVRLSLDNGQSGTYEQPIVLYGERNANGTLGVFLNCNQSASNQAGACFNIEGNVNYVAIDGFDLNGGRYGIRAVGDWASTVHQRGTVMINNNGHNQCADPFFSGEVDWLVAENNKAHDSGHCPTGNVDGHGMYLSNGGDWVIVRYNEFYGNMSSDFQINSDPMSMCDEEGIQDTAALCDGSAFLQQGEGVSEFYWVEGNYFHNGEAQGANFTGVRNSVITRNVMAFMARHGFTFWQESSNTMPAGVNPDLASNYNLISNNLFLNSRSHVLAFQEQSGNNEVVNNIVAAATTSGSAATSAALVNITGDVAGNTYSGNCTMGSNYFDEDVAGAWPRNASNHTVSFSSTWFANFNASVSSKMSNWNVQASAPAGCPRLTFTDLPTN